MLLRVRAPVHAAQAALKSIIVGRGGGGQAGVRAAHLANFDLGAPARCLVQDDILVCRPAPLNMALAIGRPPRVI